jgi:hypothetical protein
MTPKNAIPIFTKKYIDVQIKLEKIKSTKPIDAINAFALTAAEQGSRRSRKLNHPLNCTYRTVPVQYKFSGWMMGKPLHTDPFGRNCVLSLPWLMQHNVATEQQSGDFSQAKAVTSLWEAFRRKDPKVKDLRAKIGCRKAVYTRLPTIHRVSRTCEAKWKRFPCQTSLSR